MESVSQFQRYEHAYDVLNSEFFRIKDEFNEVKRDLSELTEENKKLRRDLKDSIENQLSPSEFDLPNSNIHHYIDHNDRHAIENLENQLSLMKKERENAMEMWSNSLKIISTLENDVKKLQFQAAPQTMSFDIELKNKQEEYARQEATFYKEISMLKLDLAQRDEDLNDAKLKQNEFKLEIENLNSLINQKNLDKRNLIQKEYGYDDALISLQNDINDLETKDITNKKENQYLKDAIHELQSKITAQHRQLIDAERFNAELKHQLEETVQVNKNIKSEYQNIKLIEQRNSEENIRLNNAIENLMEEAAIKTKQEIQELKKIYNVNLEKLVNECSILEADQSNKEAQLEKVIRAKKSVEQELEKISTENQRVTNKENSVYEDLHRRFCTLEREKEQALQKLETKETELRKFQANYEHNKEKNEAMFADFTEKSYIARRDIDRLSDEHAKSLTRIDELKEKISELETEKGTIQKKLTKQIQLHETETKLKSAESLNKVKIHDENHNRALFELRQLLNQQQRMSNKWKEECHSITNKSEAKFVEMKNNFENLKINNEKLRGESNELKQKELENEKIAGIYLNKIKILEQRVKDAENQATEATKRVAKQTAREKMISYEKYLLESDLTRNNFNDTFLNGKSYYQDNVKPTKE